LSSFFFALGFGVPFSLAFAGAVALRRKLVKQPGKGEKQIQDFESSIRFNYKPLFFQLPGLHKVMTAFAKGRIGVRETAKQISTIH